MMIFFFGVVNTISIISPSLVMSKRMPGPFWKGTYCICKGYLPMSAQAGMGQYSTSRFILFLDKVDGRGPCLHVCTDLLGFLYYGDVLGPLLPERGSYAFLVGVSGPFSGMKAAMTSSRDLVLVVYLT